MPSHLDDPKNILKRTQALASGLVSEEDIEGNVQADKLADQGVKQHVCNKHHAAAARDRLELTIVVQKMMLTIWEAYLEGNTTAQEVNEYDEKEVEAAMRQIQLNELEEYDDYDPFGNIDADGNDANPHDDDDSLGKNSAEALDDFHEPTSDQQPAHLNAATSDSQAAYPKVEDVIDCINAGPIIGNRASVSDSVGLTAEPVANEGDRDNLTLQQRYPKYGWNSEYMHRDYELQVTLPDGEDPTLFGSSSIASATPPISNALSQDKAAKLRDKKPTRFNIPPSWWEPCVWWLRQCEWTKCGLGIKDAKNTHMHMDGNDSSISNTNLHMTCSSYS
jgi:hypothetical protein